MTGAILFGTGITDRAGSAPKVRTRPPAEQSPRSTPPLRWTGCTARRMIPVRSNHTADKCAAVALPIEPSQPGGPSVTLRLTRFRAIGSPRAGTILRLVRPGALRGGLSPEWWLDGRSSPSDRFDVIGVELDFESIAAGNCSVDPHELGLDPFADRASIESITDLHARALASCLVKSPTPPAFVEDIEWPRSSTKCGLCLAKPS